MDTRNEVIVLLVTASNRAESLDGKDVTDMIALAIEVIGQLRAEQGVAVAPDQDDVDDLRRFAAGADRMPRDAWQPALRHAAEIIRRLQPGVEPQPALPTHSPDGGDGGNY